VTLSPCEADCEKEILKLMTVHRALGRYETSMRPVLLLQQQDLKDDPSTITLWQERYPELQRFAVMPEKWHTIFGQKTAGFFLVDPYDNVILSYDAEAQGNGMLRDVRHLIKVADNAGN